MARTPITPEPLDAIVAAALRGELDEIRARQLHARGAEAVALVLMAMARRPAKRLRAHGDHLFTFLDKPDVPFDNNFAERQIRPAVILRKNSQSNRSEQGAATQAVLMSVYRTLKLRGHNPTKTDPDALRLATGRLTPLPPPATANG